MNVKTAEAIATLSPTARKLWDRLSDERYFYLWDSKHTPKSMKELEAAGQVSTMGRVTRIERCYVPVGSTPAQMEKFP